VVLHAKPDGQRQEVQEEIIASCMDSSPVQSSHHESGPSWQSAILARTC
jgi:hypothetical protein